MVVVTIELVEVKCGCGRLICRVSPGAIVHNVCKCGITTQVVAGKR